MLFICPTESTTLEASRYKSAGIHVEAPFRGESKISGGFDDQFNFHEGASSAVAEVQPVEMAVTEEFDWSSKKNQFEFVELEQKKLAGKTLPAEDRRYEVMRFDRNKAIFAERYVRDYAEMQRIKILAEKLQELSRYLKPIPIK